MATDTDDLLSEDEIIAIIEEFGDLITALRDAEPEHKLDVYRSLGLRLTYDPETRTVRGRYRSCVQAQPVTDSYGDLVRVRRGT